VSVGNDEAIVPPFSSGRRWAASCVSKMSNSPASLTGRIEMLPETLALDTR
jgi:hypothetical protein